MEHKGLHKEHIVIEKSTAVEEVPLTEGTLRARRGFVEEAEREQDPTSEMRLAQIPETETSGSIELERVSSYCSSSALSIEIQQGWFSSRR
jgi:hypothetical protein